MKKDREKKQQYSNITDATIIGSTSEESALYASTNREHLSVLDRLEEISKRKINPNYTNQNINQQAGYSAEIKEQAHVNANNILAGKMGRLRQYDDLSSEQKAQVKNLFPNYATPSKNHELVDYVSVDEKGNVIPGTLTQSKFVGRNGEECFEKFLSKDYEKYFENGAKMKIPKDYYRDIQKATDAEIKKLESQIAKQKGLGDFQAFASSSLGGLMQSSANKIIQSLGKGSVPAMIVGACVANATILGRYFSGKIDKTELLKQLGKANTTLVSSGAMAVAGQALIPIPVVGALVGGFVGAALSETCLNALLKAREEAKLARQRRIEIEKECREIIKHLEAYQNQFKEVFEKYFHETTKFFNQSFNELERASYAGDADLAIAVNNKSREWLGQKALFDNKQEGWELIISNKYIRM
ncbi:hypothetical protein ECC06_03765 [Helicobacter pylori]|uniref:hypothetical protein n=1 Tax=Helicobacter pylori TaxID=210 RepID=UPI000FDD4538|nr:hypothetical protein [Helicobacter pylori]RVY19294.1 hypothetical protein ECC06_03765 [Helicobacter pylori]